MTSQLYVSHCISRKFTYFASQSSLLKLNAWTLKINFCLKNLRDCTIFHQKIVKKISQQESEKTNIEQLSAKFTENRLQNALLEALMSFHHVVWRQSCKFCNIYVEVSVVSECIQMIKIGQNTGIIVKNKVSRCMAHSIVVARVTDDETLLNTLYC